VDAIAELRRKLPGGRRPAVELRGRIDETVAQAIDRLRPALVRWTPTGSISVLEWGLFRSLVGRKVLAVGSEFLLPSRCDPPSPTDPAVELHLAQLLAMNGRVFPCGTGARVLLYPETDQWLVQSLVVRDPSVELVILVGADGAKASKARRLLDTLGRGPSR